MNSSLEELINIKIILFLTQGLSRKQNFPKISQLFNPQQLSWSLSSNETEVYSTLLFFFYKNVVFAAQAEYSYFSADFRLKIFLYHS